jgi:transposase-like protein
MNLITLFEKFPNEKSCISFLEKIRWREGVKCPTCGNSNVSKHKSKDREETRHQCSSCKKTFSVLVGTIFHHTHLDLRHWFYIICLMLNAKKGISACQVARDLKIRRPTVWAIMHKIRSAMSTEQKELLEGIFQMDETYIKTKDTDGDGGTGGKRPNNIPVIATLTKGKIKASKVKDITATTLLRFARRTAKEGSIFHTDASFAYNGFSNFFKHEKVKHAVEFVSPAGVHCNAVEGFWSLLKRGIKGNYHHISQKYLQNYINEFEYRYNSCGSEDLGFGEMIGRMFRV